MADDHKKKKIGSQLTADSEQQEEVDQLTSRPLDQWEQKAEEFELKYKRVLADYQNLERQTAEGMKRFAKIATQGFVEELVEPFDHLLLASKHLKDKGLEMVISQFKQVFENQGLKEINPVGQAFDPTKMEAIDTREGKENSVEEVVSVGYELNGIVIKHARVVVGKSK